MIQVEAISHCGDYRIAAPFPDDMDDYELNMALKSLVGWFSRARKIYQFSIWIDGKSEPVGDFDYQSGKLVRTDF